MKKNAPLIQHALYEQIARQFGQVYFVYLPENKQFNFINPSFEEVWPTCSEIIRQEPADLLACIHPDDRTFMGQQYEHLLTSRERKNIEFRILHPDQAVRWLTLSAYLFEEENGAQRYIGGFCEDITDRKQYLENTLKFNSKKDATLEVLSHDLAAPFANIQGLVEALEEQLKEGDYNVAHLIKFIKQDAQKGSDLIRDFVDNEFLESSQIVLRKVRVDLTTKIRTMMEDYKRGAHLIQKQFKLIALEEPIYINIDDMKFMQVLNNLISNAIKFTHDNGIITVTVEQQGANVHITVADNGVGIPPELQPKLFDKFTQARRPGVRGEKSVGLGMSIIKNIVELHSGRIWLESEENVGTTFFIELPNEELATS